jgi:hypothetical protein
LFFDFHSQNFSFFVSHLLIPCRSTEHDHVKDNLPAKLLRIRTFGKMKLEEFKDLMSSQDYKTCEAKLLKTPIWYPLTLDIFVKFLYKVILPRLPFALIAHKHVFILVILPSEDSDICGLMPFSSLFLSFIFTSLCVFQRKISNAADTAARLYRENTPESRRSATKIWDTMTKAQEKLIKSIRTRNFEKFISVTHKDNGDDFFYELRIRFVLLLAFNFIFHPL